jgi:hypothetical protein
LSVDKRRGTITASDLLLVDSSGQVKRTAEEAPPSWTAENEPSAHDLQVRDQFLRMFHPGRPILTEVVAASEDESADIKRLAIVGLKSLGDLSLLLPVLSRKDDPTARRSAIAAIRAYLGQGPAQSTLVKQQLAQEFGDDTASIVEKMLVGFSPEEASRPQLFELLVATISPEQHSVGVRELALDSLKRLTGRDDLGYGPDHPEGKGLEAWKQLLAEGKLRLTTPRTKAK